MLMKKTLIVILLVALATISAFAQEAKQDTGMKQAGAQKATDTAPTVDQILNKYVEALGGKAAIEKYTSRVTKGSFEIAAYGASGTVEIYEKAPDKNLAVIDVSGYGTIQEGYDGKTAWAQDPQSGLREKEGEELASTKIDSQLFKNLRLKELYPKMEFKGKEKFGEREVYIVEATPEGASPEKWYFDTQTGLLVRADSVRITPQGTANIHAYMSDYRDVDGIKIPFSMKQSTPSFDIDIKVEEVKHNVPIDDAKFTKPSGQ